MSEKEQCDTNCELQERVQALELRVHDLANLISDTYENLNAKLAVVEEKTNDNEERIFENANGISDLAERVQDLENA